MSNILRRFSGRAVAALAIASFALAGVFASIQSTNADVDPVGCTDNGGGVSIAAFRSDGITNIGVGTVVDGESINYKATLSALASPNCAFEGGTWTLATPDGAVHPLGAVPRIGGTGVASVTSALIPYVVNHANEIVNSTRHIDATTSYAGGESHADSLDETNGPTLGSTKQLRVVHTPTVSTDIHNAGHGVVTTVPVGTSVHDKATVTGEVGGPVPTGTVTFTKYTSAGCETGSSDAGTVALVAGVADPSNSVVAGGTSLSFKAHYNGDSNYAVADGLCENLEVTKLTSSTVTEIHNASEQAVTSVNALTTVHDKATVTPSDATGTVDFTFYNNNVCSGEGASAGSVAIVAGVAHPSSSEGPLAPGLYSFKAHYNGDSKYNPSDASCEPLTVNIVQPSISTTPTPASGNVGVVLNDSANLSGGVSPTGTITFNLYNPADSVCLNPVHTQVVAVSGNGSYNTTPGYTSLVNGTYHWAASYSGDVNNSPASSGCLDEPVVVSQLTPTVSTVVHTDNPDQAISGTLIAPIGVHDSATVTGSGPQPTGTVDFRFYSNNVCSGEGISSGTAVALVAGVAHPSTSQTALGAGNYGFKAHYNGDATYAAANGECEPFTVVAQGHIIVDKVTNPTGDLQLFHFVTTGTGYNSFDLADLTAPNDQTLNAGSYSVIENSVSGWVQTSATCTDGNNSVNPASINLLAGHTVSCVFTNTKVAQYCSPGYWKQDQHFDSYVTYHPTDLFNTVFGRNAFPGMTLVQVLSQGGGGLNAYSRAAVGALLNSTSMGSGLTAAQVIAKFQATFDGAPSGKAANGYYGSANPEFTAPENCPLN